MDPEITAIARGLWAVKWSFFGLFITALLQLVVVVLSGSVALMADMIRARLIGHRMRAEVSLSVAPDLTVDASHTISNEVGRQLQHHLQFLSGVMIHVDPATEAGEAKHGQSPHAHDGLPTHRH